MKKMLAFSTAALLALSVSSMSGASLAQGKGKGNDDREQGQGQAQGKGKGNRADSAQQERGPQGKGQGNRVEVGEPDRGPQGKGRGQGREDQPSPVARQDDRGPGDEGRGRGNDDREVVVRDVVRQPDQTVVNIPQAERVVVLGDRGRGLIAGCPPGLAKKNNGCLPPGQVNKIARARFDTLFDPIRDDVNWRYDDGYLYRFDRQGSLLGYLPALGGALAPGALWPVQYRYDPTPDYQLRYFGLTDPYDYRYANGAIYSVDPKTQAIQAVAALLTGQPIQVGRPMPMGYDVYNVPYAYRDQYFDTPDRYYRYNDGYVYQVDPTTQLVQAVIQLLL